MDCLPKYLQITHSLRETITEGQLLPGDRLPSELELAGRFSVSRLTVQRALKELQNDGLVERRAGSGTYIRHPPETKGHLFGLLIPGLGETEIFEPICQGMSRAGARAGHALLWGNTSHAPADNAARMSELCRQYIARRVSGVFFAPVERCTSQSAANAAIAEALADAGIPVVLLDWCFLRYPDRSPFDLVGIDNRRGGARMTRHIMACGARRPAFFAFPRSGYTIHDRIAGFLDVLRGTEIPDPHKRVIFADPTSVGEVERAISQLSPDGFVCGNDATAAMLLRTLHALSIKVPEQIRLTGIDDVPYAALLGVPLTTLRQPCQEIGEAAMHTMLSRIAEPLQPARDVLLETSVVIRQSCGYAPTHSTQRPD